MGPGFTSLETVPVGDPSNAPDLRYDLDQRPEGYGAVSYSYRIGKYEVTAAQYCEFLNSVARTDTYGLYSASMYTVPGCGIERGGSAGNYSYSVASDSANRPVNYVGYWDACRFVNWLHNGQPLGPQDAYTTERGAYTLDGYNDTDGRDIGRNAEAKWALASSDEWHKAAYYKGGGANAGYWDYPTMSDTQPISVGGDGYTDPGNHANCGVLNTDVGRTYVGEFENSAGPYGTFDQGGNVWEWTDSLLYADYEYPSRVIRGGSFNSVPDALGAWSGRYSGWTRPAGDKDVGFRVASIPEPSSIVALAVGLVSLLGVRRRRG